MIIIKRNGVVYFCESYCNAGHPATPEDFAKYPENRCTVQVDARPRRLIMVEDTVRAADLVRYRDVFPDKMTPQNLLRETYPALLELLEPYGLLDDDGSFSFSVAFAKGNTCYVMRGGALDEVEEFYPLCYGRDSAIAEYIRNKDEPIPRLVQRIYKSIESETRRMQFPVVVTNTKNATVRVITGKEEI